MISVKDLSFTYVGGDAPAIHDLDFQIEPGEIFGFLGPSGAGKSTTQKILIGLLRDFEGQISVFDRPLTDWGQDYYQRVGVSFELPNHYLKLTANENLRYFGSLYEGNVRKPDELLEWVGLKDDGDMLVSQYSKGMKNRLNVARSLVHDPELLFMDEPTAGLDPVNARRIKELIREQKDAGKTVFLTTHDMAVADELCDRVAFIIDGEIKLINSPRSLKLEHGKQMIKVEFGANGATEQKEFPMDGLAENEEFQGVLRQNSIQTIHSQEATLEDIFIQVTGRSLA